MKTMRTLLTSVVLCAGLLFASGAAQADTTTLQPGPGQGKDIWTTSVYSYAPGGGGPGGGLDNDILKVGGWGDYYYSLLQFDLTGAPLQATSAILRLYNADGGGAGGTPMRLDRITQFWDWRTQGTGKDRLRLWWADKPPTVQWQATPLPTPAKYAFYDIDITDLYNAWQSGQYPNYGLQLRPTLISNNWNQFYSSDYLGNPLQRPQLIVTFLPTASVPLAQQSLPNPLPPPTTATTATTSTSCNNDGRLSTYTFGSGQLSLFSLPGDCTTFDFNKPTVVISHGWNPDSSNKATPDWMNSMAKAIGNQANVLLWNWQEKAETQDSFAPFTGALSHSTCNLFTDLLQMNGYTLAAALGVPYDEVEPSGNSLAKAVDGLICSWEPGGCSTNTKSYNQPIHFIGHSLGTGVISYAARNLDTYQNNIDQLTLLDTAYLCVPPAGDELSKLKARNVFIDNYRSLVADFAVWGYDGASVNTNILLPNNLTDSGKQDCLSNEPLNDSFVTAGHGYAYRWYRSSYTNFNCPAILNDTDAPLTQSLYGSYWAPEVLGNRGVVSPAYVSLLPNNKWWLTAYDSTLPAFEDAANAQVEQTMLSLSAKFKKASTGVVTFGVNNIGQPIVNLTEKVGQVSVNAVGAVVSTAKIGADYVTIALEETKKYSTAAVTAVVDEAKATNTRVKVVAGETWNLITDAANWFSDLPGHAVQNNYIGDLGALDLSIHSNATAFSTITIPPSANKMRFGLEFLNAEPGTMLEVFIGDLRVYYTSSEQVLGKGRVFTDWIEIGRFAGNTTTLSFRLSNPRDGALATIRLTDLMIASVSPPPIPIAVAKANTLVRLGSKVALDGSLSIDSSPEPATLNFSWHQVGGPATGLLNATYAMVGFTPTIAGTYSFTLTVSNGTDTTEPALIDIKVPKLGDVDQDGDVDNDDLAKITSALNTKAIGPNDLRDIDGDGKITALDSRKLVTLCTRSRCATR